MTNETVIYGSRWKIVLLLIGCLAFVAIGIYVLRQPDVDPVMGWLCTGFFGLGVPLAVAMLVRPTTLTLRADGFTVKTVLKAFDVAWDDLEGFHVWHNPAARQKLVAWTYRPGREPQGVLADMSASLGAQGGMPGMMTIPTDKLVVLMNERLAASRA